MKILILTASLRSGGAETHIFELASALSRNSHTVTVASSGGEIATMLKKEKISHINIPLDRKSPHSLFLSFIKLRALLKNNNFDIVHVHSRISALVCRLVVGKNHTPPIVSTVHAHFKTNFLLRRLSFWGRSSIAVSEDLREYLLEEYNLPYEKICVIPNAINTDKFSPKESKIKGEGAKYHPPKILFVSRLDTDCSLGAVLLLRIAPKLSKKYPKIKIDIAGGGKAYKKISALAAKVNLSLGYECVKMLGQVTDMPKLLRSADIFVGVSRAALEAMSSALPVVLCGNEGFLGIVDASNITRAAATNFCCRDGELPDAMSLYSSVSSLLDMKSSDRQALGHYLRDYVCKRHGLDTLASLTEDFYKDAISLTPAERGDIVLCGYYGFDNLGDDALLSSAISYLRKKYPTKKISVICHSQKKISQKMGVRTVSRENIIATLREISGSEKLVLGGGSILQNSTSTRSLKYYCFLIRFAAKRGVKVELLSNGLGPIKGKRAEKTIKKALLECSRLSFRDKNSAAMAERFGCDPEKISIEDDLSSRLSPCDPSHINRILSKLGLGECRPLLVAVKGKTKRLTKKMIEEEISLQTKAGLYPIFIIMHAKEDKKISKRMAKRCGGVCLDNISPRELISLCNRAEFAIGNRFHLLYLASSRGVPILPFGDDPKLISLIK